MTARQHNKYVALAHLAFAMLAVVGVIGMAAASVMLLRIPDDVARLEGELSPPTLALFLIFAAALTMFCTVPSVFAAYAFLRRRSWAKVAGIVAAVSISLSFPLGTAVAAYTFWFLFSKPGKQIYDGASQLVDPQPPPPPTFTAAW